MRRIFAALFNFIARLIAILLAALTVIATIVVILLLSVQHSLLNTETHQRAFNENGVYERLPASARGQLSLAQSTLADSCVESMLACAIQKATPKLQTCLTDGLGENVVEEIASGSRLPDETEAEAAQGCLDRYGTSAEVPSSRILGVEGMVFLNNLTPDQWDVLIVHLLPSGDLQTMTESTLDEIIAYFKG